MANAKIFRIGKKGKEKLARIAGLWSILLCIFTVVLVLIKQL
jgi:hypothetical protein